MKIKQYEILKSKSDSELAKYVNEWIENGWQPIGGVSASTKDSNTMYVGLFCQAMVK